MSQRVQPPAVRRYLDELGSALVGVPEDVTRDILDGISEELSALEPAAAARRIEELGDPMFIAAAARAESVDPSAAAGSPGVGADTPSRTESRGYVVFVSLLVAFGGVVVPIVGWIVGLALMWFSRRWRTWEKWVATAAVPGIALLIGVIGLTVSGGVLFGFAGWHLLIVLGLLGAGNVVAGLWLLWRGLRQPAPVPEAVTRGSTAASGVAESRGYVITAALLVALGGFVVPLLGWIVGLVMVWLSAAWRGWEKWVATIAALSVGLLTGGIMAGIRSLASLTSPSLWPEPAGSGDHSVTFPTFAIALDIAWSVGLLMLALNFVIGIWLLWRGLRRPR